MSAWTPKLPDHAIPAIGQFLRAHALSERATGVVVGLSGGIDSALVARLARDALGAEHVVGVLQPDARYPVALLAETQSFARSLGIEAITVPIEPVEAAFRAALPEVTDRVTLGNITARVRMIVAHTIARERHKLVAGTGNKSELLLGYFTKYGDGGVDLLPIGDLYKTEVWEAAARLELPREIRERAPSAGLWEGQTDEGELGMPYSEIDQILYGVERLHTEEEVAERTGLALARVQEITRRIAESRHKRRPPPIAKVGFRTVGLDWRE
ncbi:MAG TPA: NAD+ synthase [Thermoplasmata archaeon]|nr:NAD+ synthase [Thermoplasmata archaeon]